MFICNIINKIISFIILGILLIIIAIYLLVRYSSDIEQGSIIPKLEGQAYTYEVLNKYNHVHDPLSGVLITNNPLLEREPKRVYPFTQGLFFISNEKLIESSGLYNHSFLREFNLNDGKTERYKNLDKQYFGEGCTLIIEPSTYKKYILQLTYNEKKILVFNYETFNLFNTFDFDFNGYGLTSNVDVLQSIDELRKNDFVLNQKLWATTGNEYLYEIEIPQNFNKKNVSLITKNKKITCKGYDINNVNELEYNSSTKTIFGNIFLTNLIIEIDTITGKCVKIINLNGLVNKCDNSEYINNNYEYVLNGIAINPNSKKEPMPTLFITGKNWSNIFEIKIKENDKDPKKK